MLHTAPNTSAPFFGKNNRQKRRRRSVQPPSNARPCWQGRAPWYLRPHQQAPSHRVCTNRTSSPAESKHGAEQKKGPGVDFAIPSARTCALLEAEATVDIAHSYVLGANGSSAIGITRFHGRCERTHPLSHLRTSER